MYDNMIHFFSTKSGFKGVGDSPVGEQTYDNLIHFSTVAGFKGVAAVRVAFWTRWLAPPLPPQ